MAPVIQNRFIRTPKFEAEAAAGRYLYNSWTTPIEAGLPNGDQAGVTVWPWGDRLYAFDEGNPGWQLDPSDLSTLERATFGLPEQDAAVFAHGKQLVDSEQFTLFGISYQNLQFNYLELDPEHRLIARRTLSALNFGPPNYMHDWFVTPHYSSCI
jgi:carotenoid cleavage dioxygenase-like enzyme